jgi:hypothetical protein
LGWFVRDYRCGGELLAMPTKGAAHLDDPATGVTVDEQILGEPQSSQESFVGDQPSWL